MCLKNKMNPKTNLRQIVKIIVLPMSVVGLNPLIKTTFYNTHILIFICNLPTVFGLYSTFMLSMYSINDFDTFVNPIGYFACLLITFISVFFLFLHKNENRYLLNEINRNIFEYPHEANDPIIYTGWLSEENWKKLRIVIILTELIPYCLAGISPFTGYIITGKIQSFLYPGYIPWKINNVYEYIGTYFSQCLTATSVFMTYHIIDIYIIFVCVEFLRQYKKLKTALITLNIRSINTILQLKTMNKNNGTESCFTDKAKLYKTMYDEKYKQNLILCLKHHQKLYR